MSFARSVKNKKLVFCCLFLVSLFTIFFFFKFSLISDEERTMRLKFIDKLIKTQASNLACRQPNLPVWSPEIMKFVHTVPKIDCSKSGMDWVKCMETVCSIQESANIQYGPLKCHFTDVYRKDDFTLSHGQPKTAETYELKNTDVVQVFCSSEEKKWSSTLVGIRKDEKIWNESSWDKLPKNSLKINVLMFGFDSISRNSFIRKLPKTYEYLKNVLETDILEGYNIVGDGTPQALIPLLTGKTELELPDTRKRVKNTKFVNSYPFIWNDYKKFGYVTAFFEDVPKIGTFTYRLNGFNKPPTDHYMRPYYLDVLNQKKKWPKLCTGENPNHKIMLNLIKDFFTVYRSKPKFLFGFHGELSHDDYNLVGVADEDFLEFLTDLRVSGALNNTVLIIMSDHGHRFAKIRNTIQGKQEERLPFFSFTFPKWFKNNNQRIYTNFKSNCNKLTTPFDIYATLKNILLLEETDTADIKQRSHSLFSKISAARSCASAYIEPHWCACLDWKEIPLSDPTVKRIAEKFTNTLNSYTSKYRNLCAPLAISKIYWVTKMKPNENLLRYKKNSDKDGFIADLSAKIDVREDTYQIKVMMIPGDSVFEASVTHELLIDSFKLKISDVSRINMYKTQARCVETDLPHLRKYCFCKN